MEIDVIGILSGGSGKIIDFFTNSYVFLAIKFFLFVYVMVLLVDIILLFMLRGVTGDLKQALFGSKRPLMQRTTIIKRWEKILSRLERDSVSQYKVAVLEADAFADEILASIGYQGTTMADKLEKVVGSQLETKNDLAEAHAVRNRIVKEPDFTLTHDEAQKCLNSYKKFFDEVELFD